MRTFRFAHLATRRSSGAKARFVFYAFGTPRLSARYGRGQEQHQGQERCFRSPWFPTPSASSGQALSQSTRKDGPPSFISCAGSQKTRRSSGAEARFVFCALGGAEAAALPRYSEAFGMTRARSRTTSRSRAVLQESVVPHPFGELRAGSFAKDAQGWGSLSFLGGQEVKSPTSRKGREKWGTPSDKGGGEVKVKVKGNGEGVRSTGHVNINSNVKTGAAGVRGSHLSQRTRKMGHPLLFLVYKEVKDPRALTLHRHGRG